MKRDYTMPKNTQESVEDRAQARLERSRDIYNYALSKPYDHTVEDVAQRVFASVIERMQPRGSETEAKNLNGFMVTTARNLLINRYREQSLIAGGIEITEQLKEQDAKTACDDSTQPETRSMLEKILAIGGGEIVEWLKEQDAKIAAATCTQWAIGSMIDAHYVPMLLDALALNDEEFDAEYPGESQVSAQQREAFAEAIQAHANHCPRCSIKFLSDMTWDKHLDSVFSRAMHHTRIYV